MTGQPRAGMFFAAGLGTRMRPLTDDRPKPLIPVGGTTLLDHALDLGAGAGLHPRVVNMHYKAAMIAGHLAGRDVILSDETGRLLETGGGLRLARPLLGPGPVFTMNTDAVWRGPNPLTALRDAWDPDRMEALLLCIDRARARGHSGTGDFKIGADGRLAAGHATVYTGAQIIDPAPLEDIAEEAFSLRLGWEAMAARGTIFGLLYAGDWCDVGRPESLPLAEELLA